MTTFAGPMAYLAILAAVCIGVTYKPIGASRRVRAPRLRVRATVGFALFLILLPLVLPALPAGPLAFLFPGRATAAETLNSPQYIQPAVMPNGQVGLIFRNDAGGGVTETRFKSYFVESGLNQSVQLSTAAPSYPQLASFQGKLIAAYVDTRGTSQLLFRVSTDNGVSWGTEYAPFGAETFDTGNSAPLLITSRDGTKLYLFNCCVSSIPQYRFTTDPTLATWSTPAAAGDGTMRAVSGNNCGNAGAECYRAHTFEFTETATAGSWVYITKSDSGFGQSGRGTQVGTLGGSWSTQVDHGGSGGLSGGGESRATSFIDRNGNVIYVRAGEKGNYLYIKRSTDGGLTWSGQIQAYTDNQINYTTGSPVGLYMPGYSKGEYVWYAGFGGSEQNAVRVIPLWSGPQLYVETGTVRLFGSLGGDLDFGAAYPYTFGRRDIPTGIGAYKTSAEDLAIPGRLLNLSFTRSYNSADNDISVLGPAWSHSFNWALTEFGSNVQIRRGDGRKDIFTRNPDLSYTPPTNVFDTLVKNGDATFTLTLKNQTKYEFSTAGKLTSIHEPAGNAITLNYVAGKLASITDTVGRVTNLGYAKGVNLALGKTYSESVAPSGSYPDNGNAELTDGTIGSATDFHDAAWQGHLNLASPLDQTVDLGSAQGLANARSLYYHDPGNGIYKPNSVEILTSPDNITYTSQGSTPVASAVNLTGGLWQYDLAFSSVSARYVRFRITSGGSWLFSTETQVFPNGGTPIAAQAGTNVGSGKTYTKSVAADVSYPDTGGTELTDGTIGDPNNYGVAAWSGYHNLGATPLDVTVDLGAAQRVGVVRSYHFDNPNVGIIRPAKIEMFTSTDNSIYTSRGSTVAQASVNDAGSRWRYEFDLAGVTARYVRFRMTTGGEWLFASEVQVFAEGAAPLTLPLSYGDRLTGLIDPIGRKVTYGYDQIGRLTRVVDKIGNAAGQDPTLHSWHYTYDAQTQHIVSVVDPDGRVRVANTYNTEGRLATQKDGAGNQSSFGYGTQQTTVTDARGHLTTQNFDSRWRLTSQVDVVGSNTYTLQYQYNDAAQNLTAVIDRNGNQTDYTYDTVGNVLTKTDPQIDPQTPRYLTQYAYDAKNNLTLITDARGFTTENTYDPTTNVKLSTKQKITAAPDTFAITKWEYTDASNPGLPTFITSPRGNTGPTPDHAFAQALSYDSQGNLTQRIDADGNKTTFGYDGVSRQTTMVDADGYAPGGVPSEHTWTTVFDQNDRVTEARDPLSHSTFTSYDGAGNRATVTDRNGNVTTYAYDGAARLATVKQKPDPVGNPTKVYTTAVTRDGNGNATSVSQDNQGGTGSVTVVTDYGYDALNRLTSATTHPSTGVNLTTSYVLDGNGNATQRTTGDNVVTTYVYDAMSRLSSVSATGLSTITYGYDELSHRISMSDGTGSSSYTYDGLGRLTQAVQPNGTLGYGYDLDSNRTTLTYPTVGSVSYAFSNAGRLSSLLDWAGNTSLYSYTATGLAKTVTTVGNLTTTYGYDKAQRLTSLVNSVASNTITSDTYTLDNEGNRTAIDEQMPAAVLDSSKVNSDTGTAVQDHPAIALGNDLPNPSAFLIWDDQRDGATNSNIYFSLRDPVAGTWGTNVKVNSDTGTRNQTNPAISVDSSNNAYAVWQDDRDGTNNKVNTNIYFSKRSAGSGTWSTPNLKVNDDTTSNPVQRNPRIAGTAAGAQTAVWVDFRSSQLNIYSSTLAAGGGTWAANLRVTDNTSSTVAKDFPDVAVGSDGTSYAVWQDSRSGNADIFFSSLASGGANWAANVKISDDPGSAAQTNPKIGVDGSGNLIAAWIDARTSPSHVRVARLPAGGSWSASTDISPSPANVQNLALSVRSDGFAWAVWGDTRAGASNQDIWGSRYDPNLSTWSAPVRLEDDPGTSANQLNPAVAMGATEVQLAWRDNRLSANGDIQGRKVQTLAGMTDHFALSYDGLNRLTKIAGPVAESFTLDGPSNITSRTGPSQTDSYDQSNRLTSDGTLSYTWSDADQLTNRGADTFGYDPLDRMTSSTVSGSARTYAYNGDGLLQSRTGNGATTFLWDPSTVVARELKQGNDNIVYGLGPLYVVKADTTTLTFVRDGSKNVRAELSSSGSVTAAFRYRAYGQIGQSTSASPTYLGFATQVLDPSGLYYMRARWYDPVVGRFLTRDALANSRLVGLNAFNYANASPQMLADPTGMCWFCPPLAAAVVGGGEIAIGVAAVATAPAWVPVAIVVASVALIGVAAVVVWNAAEDKGLEDARDARDERAIKEKANKPGAIVGAYDPKTGRIVTGCSGPGGCAEDDAAQQLGIPQEEVGFTEAVRPRTGEQVPVCIRCQEKYDQSQFPLGTDYEPGGRWGGLQ